MWIASKPTTTTVANKLLQIAHAVNQTIKQTKRMKEIRERSTHLADVPIQQSHNQV